MKKNFFMSLIFCVSAALLLVICGASTSLQTKADLRGAETEPKPEATQIPNPFVDCTSLAEAAEICGFELTAPEAIDGYSERTIMAVKDEMVQIIYQNADVYNNLSGDEQNYAAENEVNSAPAEIMIRKAVSDTDISGDYNEYDNIQTVTVQNLTVTLRGNGELVNTAVWSDGNYAFAITANGGSSSEEILALIANVR